MEELVKIFMERDGLSESEARRMVANVKAALEHTHRWGFDVEFSFIYHTELDPKEHKHILEDLIGGPYAR